MFKIEKSLPQDYFVRAMEYKAISGTSSVVTKRGDVIDVARLKARPVSDNGNGYLRVGLSGERYIHRLAAQAFIPNPENKREVNHINGDKTDNRSINLEWATHQENMAHAHALKLIKPENWAKSAMRSRVAPTFHQSERGYVAKPNARSLTTEQVRYIRHEGKTRMITDIARELGRHKAAIARCYNRHTYRDID